MPAGHRYVVHRLNWRRTPAGFVRLPGEIPVASFDTFEAAEAERRAREQTAQKAVNPFAAGLAPYEQTSMPPGVFRDWLLDAGIDPPQRFNDPSAWGKWWDAEAPGWTADQTATVWEALDKARFFRVVERPKRAVGYAVVEVVWGYNDEWYYSDGEGGTLIAVYRNRKRAEAVCAERNEQARREWADMVGEGPDDEYGGFEVADREEASADPFADADGRPSDEDEGEDLRKTSEVPFYEVIEVELEGDA
jgi:hypothetical protein